jgi:hypothetical protein
MRSRHLASMSALFVVLALAPAVRSLQAPPAATTGAKVWLGRHQEFEDYIRSARVAGKMEKLPVGITSPLKAALEPGGLVAFVAWKPIAPGVYNGYRESYKAEIAAYEIDKLIALDMVPPTVERRLDGALGAAVMWVSGTKSFAELGKAITPPPAEAARWNLQLARAMMFDDLIGNEDPNLGNWLVDTAWNVILIDHSRALQTGKDLYHKLNNADRALWERILALDETRLQTAVGTWLDNGERRAILQRRDKIRQMLDKLIKEKGEAAVFFPSR